MGYTLKGLDEESIVVGNGMVEKFRSGASRMRNEASAYRQTQVSVQKKPKKGETLPRVDVMVFCHGIMTLQVPGERRDEVDALIAALEAERDAAGG